MTRNSMMSERVISKGQGAVDAAREEPEKEEGEIEEGEIEVGDAIDDGTAIFFEEVSQEEVQQEDGSDWELEDMLVLIQNSLELSTKDSTKSFTRRCTTLKDALEKLKSVDYQLGNAKKLDTMMTSVIQQIYDGAHSVYSAYRNSNSKPGDLDKESISSLLASLSNDTHSLFSRWQIKEFEAMILSIDRDKPVEGIDIGINLSPPNFDTSESRLKSRHIDASAKGIRGPLFINPFQRVDCKPDGRGSPWDQDEMNLPSTPPARNEKPTVARKEAAMRERIPKDTQRFRHDNDNENNFVYPSSTDALKAVSSYQQKFHSTSFCSSNRLPIPTPSSEGEGEDGAATEEISSVICNKPAGSFVNNSVVCQTSTSPQPLGALLF